MSTITRIRVYRALRRIAGPALAWRIAGPAFAWRIAFAWRA